MGQDNRSQEEKDLGHLRGPKPNREQGEGSENWMKRAYQAGATMEEVSDVLALSVLFDRPCEEIKNIIVDAQTRARFGARSHVRRFGHDLKRLAGDPPGHAEIFEKGDTKVMEIAPGLGALPPKEFDVDGKAVTIEKSTGEEA